MRKYAFFALCFLSSIATAGETEEVKVVARPFRVMLENISLHHKYNPITNRWYYVAPQAQDEKGDRKEGE